MNEQSETASTTSESLKNAVESLKDVTKTVALIEDCNAKGELVSKDGKSCALVFAKCPAEPKVTSGNKLVEDKLVGFEYFGEPIIGKVATFICPKGYYSKTKAAACNLENKWTSTAANCKLCDADGPFAVCGPKLESCKDVYVEQ